MLQVKENANYFHLLTNTNTILYALTYNYFYYNLTNLRYFNTCIYKNSLKTNFQAQKRVRTSQPTPSTLNTMKKPLIKN